MSTISTICALIGYGAIVGVLLLGRLDYRRLRSKGEDWDAR
jgi:hypothetical protein